MFENAIDFIMSNWYYIMLVLFFFVIVLLWIKVGKKPKVEFYNQIEENLKTTVKELEYNPTEIKFMKHLDKTYRVYGEYYGAVVSHPEAEIKQTVSGRYTREELREFDIKNLRQKILGKEQIKVDILEHEFLVRRKFFDLILFKFYHGEKDLLILRVNDFKKIKDNTIKVNDNVRFVYRNGFYVNSDAKFIPIISEKTERLMSDHRINAVGLQQKDFSRIRSDWANKELMKDKDIEAEEKKDRAKKHG